MKDKVIVFDIWSDFAHFRKFETTTSPLTYPFPTGTSIAGLIAAIIGFPRDSYYNLFSRNNIEYSFRILSPIKRSVIPINVVKTDISNWHFLWKLKDPRAPVPYEFLKDPKYRIYVLFKNSTVEQLYLNLKKLLENHQTVYTPCLGITELIANFEFVGDFKAIPVPVEDEIREIHTVTGIGAGALIPEVGKRYGKEIIPLYMDDERRVLEYSNVIYESSGKTLKIKKDTVYEVANENVSFL
jgi:CRISPR-associated protein Cas5h